MDRTKKAIILSSLLHDIGKFWERADPGEEFLTLSTEEKNELCDFDPKTNRYRNSHVLWTKQFFKQFGEHFPPDLAGDMEQCINLACRHHAPTNTLEEIIRVADGDSSGIDRRKGEKDISLPEDEGYKKARLFSSFQQISLMWEPDTEQKYFYELFPLSNKLGELFPILKNELKPSAGESLVNRYRSLWSGDKMGFNGFINEFKKLPKHNFNLFISGLYYLLWKYTWCIPSSTKKDESSDIPLFDHLKTTAALSLCIYDWWNEDQNRDIWDKTQEKFLLLEGDISGIQNYIYGVTQSRGVRGISKRLRGRSFFINILAEVVARHFLRTFRLPICNLLFCGGGVFDILLPNSKNATQQIKDERERIEEYMMKEHFGELGLVIDFVDADETKQAGKGIKNYGDLLEGLKGEISDRKKNKNFRLWCKGGLLVGEEIFDVCRSCGSAIFNTKSRPANEDICQYCENQKRLGKDLLKVKQIVYAEDTVDMPPKGPKPIDFGFLGKVFLICDETAPQNILENTKVLDVQTINDLNNLAIGFKFLGNTVPRAKQDLPDLIDDEDEPVRKGNILSFEHMSDMSIGDRKLGYLKMDMDNLGLVSALGLEEKLRSVTRLSFLSRLIDTFFCHYINKVCEEQFEQWKNESDWKHKNDISNIFYTCYSGGDDLLIIGPWSEIPKLAQRIEQQFKRFTCHNRNISLSAGVFVAKPKFTIGRASQLAGVELEKSKDHGRDRITLFGDTVAWTDQNRETGFDSLIDVGDYFFELVNQQKIARGFVHGLLRKRKQFFKEDKNELDHNFIPALIYQIARTVKDEKLKTELKEKLVSSTDSYKLFKAIKIPAIYALMKSRTL